MDKYESIDKIKKLKNSLKEAEAEFQKLRLTEEALIASLTSLSENLFTRSFPRVNKIYPTLSGWMIETDDIYGQYKEGTKRARTFYIGKFNVHISFDNEIYFKNTHALDTRYAHPHQNGQDEVCLGGFYTLINSCFQNREYENLILVILEFLSHISEDAFTLNGEHILEFFKKKKPESKKIIESGWIKLY